MKRVLKIFSIYELIIFLAIFFIMLCDKENSLIKTVVLTSGITGIFVVFNNLFKDKLIALISMTFFTMPFNIILFQEHVGNFINTAGAKSYFIIKFTDILIVLMAAYIWKNRKKVDKKILILPGIFLSINIVCAIISINKIVSIYEVLRIMKLMIIFIFSYLTFNRKTYKIMLGSLGVSIIVQLLIGIIQMLIGRPLGIEFLGESTTVFRDGVTGLERGFSGTMAHPGTLALFGVFIFCLIIYSNKNIEGRKVYILGTVLIVCLTFARTSIVLMFIAYLIALVVKYNKTIIKKIDINKIRKLRSTFNIKLSRKKVIVIVSTISVGVVVFILFRSSIMAIFNRFTNSDVLYQLKGRSGHVKLALDIVEHNKWIPYGANTYVEASKLIYPMKFAKGIFNYVQPVHNIYALYLVEIGILGLLSYISLSVVMVINSIKALKNRKIEKYERSIAFTIITWIILFSIYGMTGWSGAKDYFMFIFWIVLGISYKINNKSMEV